LEWCKKPSTKEVYIEVPKWKITPPSIQLSGALRAMGLEVPFSTQNANFGKITPSNIYIGKVIHKAMIEVNEAGAEAAAATVVIMPSRSVKEVQFLRLNRPFLYFIKDNATETILFMGQVVDPSKSK
jgi:serpin B